MRATTSFATLLLCSLATAQFGADTLFGSMPGMTCSNGQVPTITCSDPTPEMCGCTCSDGAMFNHERPSHLGPPPVAPPPPVLDPIRQLTEKPCTGQIIQPWSEFIVRRTMGKREDSEIKSMPYKASEDGILLIADSRGRCEHFDVYIDDRWVGETSGTSPLDNFKCGGPDECMTQHGGQHAYFTLPKGDYKLGLKWSKVTPPCDTFENGLAHLQFYRNC